jgi:hypothetical protein
VSGDPDLANDASEFDGEVALALERLLELAESLAELPLDDAAPSGEPPRWQ